MPIYTYKCRGGHKQEEFFFTIAEAKKCVLVVCKTCGLQMERTIDKPQPPRIAKQTGFISQGRLLKKDSERAKKVRDVYLGNSTDEQEIVP